MAKKRATIEVYSNECGGVIARTKATGWDDKAQQPVWSVTFEEEVSAGQMLAIARRVAYASTQDGASIGSLDFRELEVNTGDDLLFRGCDLPFEIKDFADDGFPADDDT